MFERGTLRIASYRGAPVLLHWSLALGLLAFGGIRFVPGFWLGFTLLILIHELGHAYLVRRMGYGVQAVVVHGFGGFCSWNGHATRLEHAVIAWGGVLGQAILLALTYAYISVFGEPTSVFGWQVRDAWIRANLWIMALNLLPVAPLDGAEAWQLFRAMRVESVSFRELVGRCLPRFRRRRPKSSLPRSSQRPVEKSPSRSRPPAEGTKRGASDGKPSKQAEAAIADALERIAKQAREARGKK